MNPEIQAMLRALLHPPDMREETLYKTLHLFNVFKFCFESMEEYEITKEERERLKVRLAIWSWWVQYRDLFYHGFGLESCYSPFATLVNILNIATADCFRRSDSRTIIHTPRQEIVC